MSNRTETIAKGGRRSLRLYRPVGENLVYVTGAIPLEDAGSSEDVTMHDPAKLFASLFKDALTKHGISVGGVARSMHWLDREAAPLDLQQWTEIGAVYGTSKQGAQQRFRSAVVSETATNAWTRRAAAGRNATSPRDPGFLPCLVWIATALTNRAAGAP